VLAKKTIAILMINAVVLNPSSVVSVEKKAHKMGSNVQATRTMETNSGALEDLPVSIMNMKMERPTEDVPLNMAMKPASKLLEMDP